HLLPISHTSAKPPVPIAIFPYTSLFRSRKGSLLRKARRQPFEQRLGDLLEKARGGVVARLAVQHSRLRVREVEPVARARQALPLDRKSTRLNSSHDQSSHAGFRLINETA